MRVFFDSSAFAKRYIREEGTDTVLSWCEQATELCLAGTALPEIVSAMCRLLRAGRISSAQYLDIKGRLLADIGGAAICDLAPEVIRLAIAAIEANVIRGMDAIHVGSAVALSVDVCVSADVRQCTAANQAGLLVIQV